MLNKGNTVIFLPTGTGKTLVSIMIMKKMIDSQKNKRIWFLAPTVPLIAQQAEKFMDETGMAAAIIHGQQAAFTRQTTMVGCPVIFSTPQILLNEIKEKKVLLEEMSLLVFDEAHHAVKNTAYNQIMRDFYWTMAPDKRPKVFGMTASPGACDEYYSTLEKIGQLCLNLSATIQMPLDTEAELRKFSGEPSMDFRETKYTREELKASDDIVQYLRDMLYLMPPVVQRALPHGAESVHNRTYIVSLHEIDKVAEENNFDDVKNLCNHMRSCCEAWETLADLGHVYASGLVSKEIASFAEQVSTSQVSGPVINEWIQMVKSSSAVKRVLQLSPRGTSVDPDVLLKCPKVAELVNVLQYYKEDPKVRIIVFTKMRSTAFKLRDALVSFEHLGQLRDKIGVLVGHGSKSGEQGMKPRQQIEICDKFEAGEINLLIATSVAEEGLDIPACNVVIRYDILETVTNFVQSRGRARAKNSDFVYIFRDRLEEKSIERIQFQERNMRRAVREIMNGVISFQNTLEALSSVDARPFVEEDCVGILKHYCAKRCGHKSEMLERYMEVMSSNPKIKPRYVCKLILPDGAELGNRAVVGEARKNLTLAKRDACYQACVQLHASGALQKAVGADFVLIKQRRATDGRSQLIRMNEENQTANIEDLVDDDDRTLYIVNIPHHIQADHIAQWLLEQTGCPRILEVYVFPPGASEAAVLSQKSYAVVKLVSLEDVFAVTSAARSHSFDGETISEIRRHHQVFDIKPELSTILPPSLRNASVEDSEDAHDSGEAGFAAERGISREARIQVARKSGRLITDEEGWFDVRNLNGRDDRGPDGGRSYNKRYRDRHNHFHDSDDENNAKRRKVSDGAATGVTAPPRFVEVKSEPREDLSFVLKMKPMFTATNSNPFKTQIKAGKSMLADLMNIASK